MSKNLEKYLELTKKLSDYFHESIFDGNLFNHINRYNEIVMDIRNNCNADECLVYEKTRNPNNVAEAIINNLFFRELEKF